uniref:GIY-YIG endonuclease n=1 Tax=Monilinia laxa TaxID=61186 RepID=A0A7L8EY13_MONLA|nr:GIY-YIG endonuclease [Monilinia laxa]QOE17400.1 GIY-YIG endonuclease [Monilinia laxa]
MFYLLLMIRRPITNEGDGGFSNKNHTKSILYYFTTQQKDFISKLNISHFTFTKHLTKGTYYLGKYLFLREQVDTAKVTNILLPDIALMLQKDRVNFNKNKAVNS